MTNIFDGPAIIGQADTELVSRCQRHGTVWAAKGSEGVYSFISRQYEGFYDWYMSLGHGEPVMVRASVRFDKGLTPCLQVVRNVTP